MHEGLIGRNVAYDFFAHDIRRVCERSDVQEYVAEGRDRQKDLALFGGFDKLATMFERIATQPAFIR